MRRWVAGLCLGCLLGTAFLLACQTKYKNIPRTDLLASFRDGSAVLDCFWGCFYDEKEGENLLRAQAYEELAYQVLKSGYPVGSSWYYLARAADGLGYKEAAFVYYQKCLSTSYIPMVAVGERGLEISGRISSLRAELTPRPCPQPTVYAKEETGIRLGPGTEFPISRTVSAGEALSCKLRQGVWYKLDAGTESDAWIHMGLVRTTASPN